MSTEKKATRLKTSIYYQTKQSKQKQIFIIDLKPKQIFNHSITSRLIPSADL